jgi:hypothetical protein
MEQPGDQRNESLDTKKIENYSFEINQNKKVVILIFLKLNEAVSKQNWDGLPILIYFLFFNFYGDMTAKNLAMINAENALSNILITRNELLYINKRNT